MMTEPPHSPKTHSPKTHAPKTRTQETQPPVIHPPERMPATLSELGSPLVSARSAEIYHWQDGEILKLFRAGFCENSARQEKLNAEEAHRQGATSIECLGQVSIENRSGIVMKRLDGRTLTERADANPLHIWGLPYTLARLHADVHNARSEKMQDIRQIIAGFLQHSAMDFLTSAEKQTALAYLADLPDGNAILHMDFHTGNILVNARTETVIDWATAARGDAGADIAMTCFLFNEAELFPGISKAQEVFYNLMRRMIYRRYFRHYLRIRKLNKEKVKQDIDLWYPAVLICRLALWSAPTEIKPLQQKIRQRLQGLSTAQKITGKIAGKADAR